MRKLRNAILFLLFSSLPFNTFSKIEREEAENSENIDNSVIIARITNDDIEVSVPILIFSFSDTEIKLKFKNREHTRLLFNMLYNKNKINFIINGEDVALNFINGEASFKKRFDSNTDLTIFTEDFSYDHKIIVFPLWTSIAVIALLIVLMVYRMVRKK